MIIFNIDYSFSVLIELIIHIKQRKIEIDYEQMGEVHFF